MDAKVMGLLIALVVTVLLAGPLAGALRRHPAVFYVVAVVLTGVYVWVMQEGLAPTYARPLTTVLQKGYLASLLVGVVMFTGCLGEGSALRRHLAPVRGELSVLAFVFVMGHVLTYLPSYLGRFGALFAARTNVAVSLVIALVLTALFAVLALTSLRVVRRHMGGRAWKRLQRSAYVMVALLAAHVAFVLGRSAFVGGAPTALASFVAYVGIIAIYAVLRVRKALHDRGRGSLTGELATA